METIKSAVGLGGKKEQSQELQSGQEPVSGEKGAGKAGAPFDKGNEEGNPDQSGKAPQHTNKAADATASGKSDPAVPEPDSKPSKSASKIGSAGWLKNANPFGKRKDDHGQQRPAHDNDKPSTGGLSDKQLKEEKERPPNQLGSLVPGGQSTDLDTTPRIEKSAASNKPAEPRDKMENSNTDPKQAETPYATQPINEPNAATNSASSKARREAYGSNPSAIPTAGGIQVGAEHIAAREEQRRLSQQPPPPPSASAGSESSPNNAGLSPVTQANTDANRGVGIPPTKLAVPDQRASKKADGVDDTTNEADDSKGRRKSLLSKLGSKLTPDKLKKDKSP